LALIDTIKQTLRISSTAYSTEIADLILAAKDDLVMAGVTSEAIVEDDPLIKRAITLYCKSNFGWSNTDGAKLQQSYEMLRNHLSQSTDYAFFTVTFTITDVSDDSVIRQASVEFNDEVKTTDENGQAVFYIRAGSNYAYAITAEGYISDDDDDNLVDITTASEEIEIALTGV
jgi:hypothetical protein